MKPQWTLEGPWRQILWPPFLEWRAHVELRLPGKIYRIHAEGCTEAEALANARDKLREHPWRSLGGELSQD